MTPLTPKKMTFSSFETRQRADDFPNRAAGRLVKSRPDAMKTETELQSREHSSSSSNRDLEKGLPVSAIRVEPKSENDSNTQHGTANKGRKRPAPPCVSIPSSAFEMDSPKTPMWKKVFGR